MLAPIGKALKVKIMIVGLLNLPRNGAQQFTKIQIFSVCKQNCDRRCTFSAGISFLQTQITFFLLLKTSLTFFKWTIHGPFSVYHYRSFSNKECITPNTVKNVHVHPVSSAGIRTRDLLNTSLLQ